MQDEKALADENVPVPPSISFSPQQEQAYHDVMQWLNEGDFEGDRRVRRLFGFAGTGKTTIAKRLVQDWRPEGRPAVVKFAAFTGKAALVMRRNGMNASTIHSLVYVFVPPDKDRYNKLKEQIAAMEEQGQHDTVKELRKELKDAQAPQYVINDASLLATADIAVLDECSMIDDELMADVLSFEKPILILGDPGQLPPIKGANSIVNGHPHNLLTQVHRQAEGSPIIKLATIARQQEWPKWPQGEIGDGCAVIGVRELQQSMLTDAQQIICGKNVTRKGLNVRLRQYLNIPMDPTKPNYPVCGDRLICLRNNKKLSIFNGQQFKVVDVGKEYDRYVYYTLLPEDSDKVIELPILRAHFEEYTDPEAVKKLQWWDFQDANEFDFGYAITCHKAQGSQWDSVLIYDDGFYSWDRGMRRKWLYTGITRAAKKLVLVTSSK